MTTIGEEFEYYADLLQVSYDVTADDIKKAYESMMQYLHPDSGGAAATFKEITDAYRTLLEHLGSKALSDVETTNPAVEIIDAIGEKLTTDGDQLRQEVRTFRCQHCDRAFPTKQGLERHVRCHTDEKPFICSVCQKAFRRSDYLSVHRRVHTGEKPYNCSHCNMKFAKKQTLRYHEPSHSGERRCKCNDCPAAFVTPQGLKRHRKVHSSGGPTRVCAKCGRCFSRASDHLAHFKKCQVVRF